MWIVKRLCKFTDFETKAGFPIPIEIDASPAVGFLPVYATREDALADYPDSDLVEIRFIDPRIGM